MKQAARDDPRGVVRAEELRRMQWVDDATDSLQASR